MILVGIFTVVYKRRKAQLQFATAVIRHSNPHDEFRSAPSILPQGNIAAQQFTASPLSLHDMPPTSSPSSSPPRVENTDTRRVRQTSDEPYRRPNKALLGPAQEPPHRVTAANRRHTASARSLLPPVAAMLAATVWLGFRVSSSAAVIPGRALSRGGPLAVVEKPLRAHCPRRGFPFGARPRGGRGGSQGHPPR